MKTRGTKPPAGKKQGAAKRKRQSLAGLMPLLLDRSDLLRTLYRFEEAVADGERVLALDPEHPRAFGEAAKAAVRICDWPRRVRFAEALKNHTINEKAITDPLIFLNHHDEPSLQIRCARQFLKSVIPVLPPPIHEKARQRHDKARIAYVSSDFHEHATSYLIAELFERHDRKRFELFGISFGPDDKSKMRGRLVKAFDHFHDVRGRGDYEVAKLLNELGIDIAVDLKGYTQNSRFGIFAHRPAPIQVSYLGFPGTTGAGFIDYVIADEIVLPFDQQPFWSEKIVHLPGCYQVNDRKRQIAERTPTRRECGLPERAFVFCSFNNNYKIAPPIFDIWMRLLHEVKGSVLWLLRDNAAAERNLRREAAARGIDAVRLVFADRLPLAEHLARHRLADLFLDTLPRDHGRGFHRLCDRGRNRPALRSAALLEREDRSPAGLLPGQ
jgi:protein O-GlcNAc transferase